MQKDNAVIRADEKQAAELRLRGYREEGEPTAGEQSKKEVAALEERIKELEAENAALKAAAEEKAAPKTDKKK